MLIILRIVIPIVMVIGDYNPDIDGDPIIGMTAPAVSRFSDKWHSQILGSFELSLLFGHNRTSVAFCVGSKIFL